MLRGALRARFGAVFGHPVKVGCKQSRNGFQMSVLTVDEDEQQERMFNWDRLSFTRPIQFDGQPNICESREREKEREMPG